MAYRPKRWMTRDFVFTAPVGFPDVVARELERFDLRPYPSGSEIPLLFVLARDADKPWEPDAMFAEVSADLIGPNGPDEWSLTPVQVLGRERRYGTGAGPSVTAGVTIVRGRDDRVWAFGWRSAASERDAVETGFIALMQGLQARSDRIGEKTLRSQFHSQEKARQATMAAIDAGQVAETVYPMLRISSGKNASRQPSEKTTHRRHRSSGRTRSRWWKSPSAKRRPWLPAVSAAGLTCRRACGRAMSAECVIRF